MICTHGVSRESFDTSEGNDTPDPAYKFTTDLGVELVSPAEGILSRTLYKVIGFGFATGEELSEHTAQMPAVMYFLSGET